MRAIGVHTAGQTVRVAELAPFGAGLRIVRLETASLPATPAASASNGSNGRKAQNNIPCLASLPPFEVLTRICLLPATSAAKVRAMVSHQLEADLPIPLELLEWDCRVARLSRGTEARVLAQAARRERIARHVDLLRTMGLLPSTITTEAEALAELAVHGLSLGAEAGSFALVLAGEREWLLAVFCEQLVRAVRRITFDPSQAEAAALELRQVITAESSESGIKSIWWCGWPEAQAPLGSLAELLNVPLRTALSDLREESGAVLAREKLVEFGPAIGLALAGAHRNESIIRLGGVALQEASGTETRIEELLKRPRRLIAAAAIGMILATGVHLGALASETGRMLQQLGTPTSMPADLDAKVRAMQRLQLYRIDVEGVMAEITRIIPDSTLISSVQLSRERRLVLKGTSKDAKAPFSLADSLRKSSRFANVTPERAAPGQGGEFTVTADVVGIQKLTGASRRGASWR